MPIIIFFLGLNNNCYTPLINLLNNLLFIKKNKYLNYNLQTIFIFKINISVPEEKWESSP